MTHMTAFLKATIAVTAWGASFIATKIALKEVSPATVVWIRFAMGVVVLGAFNVHRRQFALVSRRELGYFVLLGLIGVTFHQWLQSNGLVTAQATTSAWIVASTPIFMALLGWLFLKEALNGETIAGIALAAFGVLLVVSKGDLSAVLHGSFGTRGDFLIVISAPNWAVFSVLSRWGLRRHPAARMMFYVLTIGWLLLTVLFIAESGYDEIDQLTGEGWLALAFLGFVCSGVAYIFWYDALQALPTAQVGTFLYLEPLVAVVVAAIVLREPLVAAAMVGGMAILAGVWIVNRVKLKKQKFAA